MGLTQRRRHPRARVDIRVDWGWRRGGEYNARLSSLSVGGCFIQTEMGALRGQPIFIQMWLSPSTYAEIEGAVAYNLEKVGLGVEFTGIGDEDRKSIQQIVDFHLAKASEVVG
ncbi:MAG TPA: PilZ domain-containing protein [Pyrinomonadaceae bacterium]|jgi:hypothetical protein|nr:PilZ domain-containing protein [Pyrinomonadaceae bacterium]